MFTKVVSVVAAHLRMQSIRLAVYLDDWLALNAIRRLLLQDREKILNLLSQLGFLINVEKSELTPTQDITYIGGRFLLAKGIVLPTVDRIVKLREAILEIRKRSGTARQYLQMLGLMASCIEVVPYARLHMRPMQLHLLYWWKPVSGDLEMQIPKSQHLVDHLNWWLLEANMLKGRLFLQRGISKTINTDASMLGWGGNLGHQIVQGLWPPEKRSWHINCLELEAVLLTIKRFLPQLVNQTVLIRSDNTTVVQYISRQGGTKSTQLCYKAWELWKLAIENKIELKAAHIAGRLNVLPDQLSRIWIRPTEWTLNDSILRKIFQIWEKPEQENGPVLQLGTTSASLCGRCVLNNMGSNVCICVPANLSSSQGVGAHEAGALQNHSDSTPVAETSLVSRVTPAMCSKSNTSTNHSSNVESTGISDISSQSQGIQSQCMVAINRQLSTKGFSQRVRDLLSASWRAGTQRDYSCKFRQFSSWCSQRQIDLYSASLAECAEFLTFLFHKGLQYRTIAGYRSMLSSVLQPIDNIPVGQHPYIIRLLKGIFNSRPPRVKLLPEWDLRLVLKLLKKPPFEPLLLAPLKYLTWKSVFLVAITTFRRSSDIQALTLGGGNVSMQNRAITFIRQGLSKSDRPRHVNSKIVVPAFSEDKLLDPVRVLKCYLKRTKKFRNFGQDQAKMGLFLSFMEPHKPVTSQTIAKWLVRVIKLAYEDSVTKVKGHSTRAIGPSWALYNGASMSSILDAADWSKESTFVRFYLRDLNEAAVLKM